MDKEVFEEEPVDSENITRAVEEAVQVKSHLEKDVLEKCAYCGQHFGPDDIVVQKEVFGKKLAFCTEDCHNGFMEHQEFSDEDLDAEPEIVVNIGQDH